MSPEPVDSDIPLAAALDPNTFEVELSLEIASESEDQIVSRAPADGYTYQDLEGSRVCFSSQDSDLGAVPADAMGHPELTTYGWCESVELYLSAKNFGGKTVGLGLYRSEEQLEAAKAAIIASINP